MKRSSGFSIYLERAAVSDRHLFLLTLLVGSIGGLLLAVGLQVSLPGTLLLTATLVALVWALMIGQIKGPLLALLGLSLPLHLDLYLGFYALNAVSGPSAALARIALNDLVVVGLIFLWLWESALGKGKPIKLFPGVTVPAVLLLVLGTISMLSAPEPRLAVYQMLEWAKGLVLYIYLANCIRDELDFKWVLAGLMLGVLFQSCLGLYQAIIQRPLGLVFLGERMMVRYQILASQMTVRPTGTLWHPNHLAMYLEMVLPVVGAVLLAPAIASHAKHGISQRWRLAAMLVVVVGLATAIYTLSRGAWLSLGVAAAVLVWWGVRRRVIARSYAVLGLMGMLVIAVLMNSLTGGAIMERLTGPDLGSAQSRIPLMRGALAVIADHPLLGSGLNNYATVIRSYDLSGEFTEFGLLPVVHNLYLLIAAEIGLLGLGAFLWLLAALGSKGIRFLYRQPSPSLRTALVAGLLASGLASLLHNLVDFGLLGEPQLTYTFWFLAGLLVALSNQ